MIEFTDLFEKYYGKTNVTMNIHLLRHLYDSVLNHGPIWSNSMFAFEQNNGQLIEKVHSKCHVILEIAEKYVQACSIESVPTHKEKLIPRCLISSDKIDPDDLQIIQNSGMPVENVRFWCQLHINGVKFTSKLYTGATRTADYFVCLEMSQMGIVKFFFEHKQILYAFIDEYEVVKRVQHLLEVQSRCLDHNIYSVDFIEKKMIFMQFGRKQIVTSIPNPFEKT